MKKKTKICGVCVALAAVLLISAALVTGCIEPVSPGGLTIKYGQVPNFTPPLISERTTDLESPGAVDVEVVEEKGYLRLNVSAPDSGARTILPSGAPTILQYMVITKRGSEAEVQQPRVLAAAISTPIDLTTGTYSVEVRGYATVGSNVVVAVGTASGVNVVAPPATQATENITLHEVYGTSAAETGTFTWNFDLSTPDPDTATLNVTNWSGADTVPSGLKNLVLDITTDVSAVTGNGTLISGYYYVDLILTKSECRAETYREIIHIANGLTSDWSKDDFSALSRNVYVVTYKEATGPTTSDDPDGNHLHGSTIAAAPLNPPGYTTAGWYRTNTYTNPWVFGAAGTGTIVIRDITLYPNWQPVTSGTLTITLGSFTLEDGTDKTFTFAASGAGISGNVITYAQADIEDPSKFPHKITITLTGSTFTTATLFAGSTQLSTTAPNNETPLTLTIDLDDGDNVFLQGGETHNLSISGVVGGIPYSAPLKLNITPVP